MIRAEAISFSYGRKRPVLNKVSLDLEPGEVLGIIGPNGAGKSTLIRCLNRLLRPRTGRVLLNGRDIATFSGKEIARVIGYVPQNQSAAFPCKVIEVVMAGLGRPANQAVASEQARRAIHALARLSMEGMAMRNFNALSGGEQQKVVIARVMASQTRIMLFDEPTSNLDIQYQFQTLNQVRQMTAGQDRSAVIAIHDLNMAMAYCDRILILDKGRVNALGPPGTVMTGQNIKAVFGIETEVIRTTHRNILVFKDTL